MTISLEYISFPPEPETVPDIQRAAFWNGLGSCAICGYYSYSNGNTTMAALWALCITQYLWRYAAARRRAQ